MNKNVEDANSILRKRWYSMTHCTVISVRMIAQSRKCKSYLSVTYVSATIDDRRNHITHMYMRA